jgi:hypothetical protein
MTDWAGRWVTSYVGKLRRTVWLRRARERGCDWHTVNEAVNAVRSLGHPGRGGHRWMNRWKAALNAFAITFEGRIVPTDR